MRESLYKLNLRCTCEVRRAGKGEVSFPFPFFCLLVMLFVVKTCEVAVPARLSRAKQNSTTHLMSFSPSNQGCYCISIRHFPQFICQLNFVH
ncbi:hypothetical protein COLO4_18052 [Corchorus olitorius]|uniref:Uncharacterized protein n=1 Tax=Corchorus olitorius TaxID=93759 RepID=A0A1R3JAM1_9ROSI|nr:hypothetical protein COLO4_18052 [Corchorus olitorius]